MKEHKYIKQIYKTFVSMMNGNTGKEGENAVKQLYKKYPNYSKFENALESYSKQIQDLEGRVSSMKDDNIYTEEDYEIFLQYRDEMKKMYNHLKSLKETISNKTFMEMLGKKIFYRDEDAISTHTKVIENYHRLGVLDIVAFYFGKIIYKSQLRKRRVSDEVLKNRLKVYINILDKSYEYIKKLYDALNKFEKEAQNRFNDTTWKKVKEYLTQVKRDVIESILSQRIYKMSIREDNSYCIVASIIEYLYNEYVKHYIGNHQAYKDEKILWALKMLKTDVSVASIGGLPSLSSGESIEHFMSDEDNSYEFDEVVIIEKWWKSDPPLLADEDIPVEEADDPYLQSHWYP